MLECLQKSFAVDRCKKGEIGFPLKPSGSCCIYLSATRHEYEFYLGEPTRSGLHNAAQPRQHGRSLPANVSATNLLIRLDWNYPHCGMLPCSSAPSGLKNLRHAEGPCKDRGGCMVGRKSPWPPSRGATATRAVAPFALGVSLGLSTFALSQLSRRLQRYLKRHFLRDEAQPSSSGLGHALVQAAARGPEGLDVKARAAYDLIREAAEAGVKEFSSSRHLSWFASYWRPVTLAESSE